MQLDQTACKRRRVVMEDKARTTAILVCNKVGHVLLQKRDNLPTIEEPGKWDVWGGHCEVGETPEVGAVREELGIEIADPQVLTFLMTRSVDGREECVWAYVVEADGTPPVHEGERAEWCAPEDAARLAMAFGAERLLAPEVVAQAKATRYRVTVTVRQPFADKWSPVKGVGHPTASPSDMRQPLCVRSCLCRTTQGITRIEQDIWLNAKRVVMQLSLRESSDRLMLIGGQRHLIRCRCGKVDEPDMVMRGGNRMDIQIDGWV
jgi:8-oxo-dGTP pyrophosphatase MutT (NUDIX family)